MIGKSVRNFGDSRENVLDLYGDSSENLLNVLVVVILLRKSDLLRLLLRLWLFYSA